MSIPCYTSVSLDAIVSPVFANYWTEFNDSADFDDEVSAYDVDTSATIIAIKVPYQNSLYSFSTRLRPSTEKTVRLCGGGKSDMVRAKDVDENAVRFRQLL